MGPKADMRIRSFLRMYDFGVKEQFESIINKLTLLLVYFYDAYDVNPWEEIELHRFMREDQTQLKTKQLKQNIFKSIKIYSFF